MIYITDDQYRALRKMRLCDTDMIDSIRSSIVPTERLLDGLNPIIIDDKITRNTVICYAYALGIMYSEQFKSESYRNSISYFPGFTLENTFSGCGENFVENLMELVKQDLENLRISYREIPLNGDISLVKGEYLVKAFVKRRYWIGSSDFHFIRYSQKANIWFHKRGRYLQPQVIEHCKYNEPGYMEIEFEKNSIYGREPKVMQDGCGGYYDPVGYFAIKEPW